MGRVYAFALAQELASDERVRCGPKVDERLAEVIALPVGKQSAVLQHGYDYW